MRVFFRVEPVIMGHGGLEYKLTTLVQRGAHWDEERIDHIFHLDEVESVKMARKEDLKASIELSRRMKEEEEKCRQFDEEIEIH